MTFRAFLPRVMVFDRDLVKPRRAGWVGFMTANTMAARQFDRRDVRIIRMVAADPVAGFAGKSFVFPLGEVQEDLGVTFIARLFPGENWRVGRGFLQRRAAVEAEFSEGFRREQLAGDEVRNHNHDG